MLFFIEKLNYLIRILLMGAVFLMAAGFLCHCIRKRMKQSGYLYFLYGLMLLSGGITALALLWAMCCLFLPQDMFFQQKWTFFFSGWYRMYGLEMFLATAVAIFLWFAGFLRKLSKILKKHKEMQRFYQLNQPVSEPQTQERFQKAAKQVGVKNVPLLFYNQRVQIPFLKGIRYPAVVIPEKILSSQEQTVSFAHELMHLKHKDLAIRSFFRGLFAIYWFIPLEAVWEQEIIELQESLCDIAVCKQYKNCFSASMYYQTILNIAGGIRTHWQNPNCYLLSENTETSDSAGQLERRIGNMSDYQHRIPRKSWMAAVTMGCAAWLFAITAVGIVLSDFLFLQNEKVEAAGKNEAIFWSSSGVKTNLMESEADPLEIETVVSETETGNMLVWDALTKYSLKPGEQICSEQFRAENGEVLILLAVASDSGYEIGLQSDRNMTIVSDAEENASINLELAEGEYRVYIRNQTDKELEIEVYCKP